MQIQVICTGNEAIKNKLKRHAISFSTKWHRPTSFTYICIHVCWHL